MLTKKFQSLDPMFEKIDKSIKEEARLRQEAEKKTYLVNLKTIKKYLIIQKVSEISKN